LIESPGEFFKSDEVLKKDAVIELIEETNVEVLDAEPQDEGNHNDQDHGDSHSHGKEEGHGHSHAHGKDKQV
jgi:hypothetical protein